MAPCTRYTDLELFLLPIALITIFIGTLANERNRADEWVLLVEHRDKEIHGLTERCEDHDARIAAKVIAAAVCHRVFFIKSFLSEVLNQ